MLPTINNVGEGLFVEKVSVWKQQIVVGTCPYAPLASSAPNRSTTLTRQEDVLDARFCHSIGHHITLLEGCTGVN